MPFLCLTEPEVRQVLTMEMALDAVESALRKLGLDEAQNIPRSRCQTDHVVLHVMSAAAKTLGIAGYKAYTTSKKGAAFHIGLFDGVHSHGERLGALRYGERWLQQARDQQRPFADWRSGRKLRAVIAVCGDDGFDYRVVADADDHGVEQAL